MIRLLLAVIALIALALVAGAWLGFNPAILIFAVLGFGIYMVGRIGGPPLPVINPDRDDQLIREGAPEGLYDQPTGGVYSGDIDFPGLGRHQLGQPRRGDGDGHRPEPEQLAAGPSPIRADASPDRPWCRA